MASETGKRVRQGTRKRRTAAEIERDTKVERRLATLEGHIADWAAWCHKLQARVEALEGKQP